MMSISSAALRPPPDHQAQGVVHVAGLGVVVDVAADVPGAVGAADLGDPGPVPSSSTHVSCAGLECRRPQRLSVRSPRPARCTSGCNTATAAHSGTRSVDRIRGARVDVPQGDDADEQPHERDRLEHDQRPGGDQIPALRRHREQHAPGHIEQERPGSTPCRPAVPTVAIASARSRPAQQVGPSGQRRAALDARLERACPRSRVSTPRSGADGGPPRRHRHAFR